MGRLIASTGGSSTSRSRGSSAAGPSWSATRSPRHCTPESFADGRLVVRTDSTAWATQLKLLAPTVVRRLNEELGHGTVTVIEVLGPHLPTLDQGAARQP